MPIRLGVNKKIITCLRREDGFGGAGGGRLHKCAKIYWKFDQIIIISNGSRLERHKSFLFPDLAVIAQA